MPPLIRNISLIVSLQISLVIPLVVISLVILSKHFSAIMCVLEMPRVLEPFAILGLLLVLRINFVMAIHVNLMILFLRMMRLFVSLSNVDEVSVVEGNVLVEVLFVDRLLGLVSQTRCLVLAVSWMVGH